MKLKAETLKLEGGKRKAKARGVIMIGLMWQTAPPRMPIPSPAT